MMPIFNRRWFLRNSTFWVLGAPALIGMESPCFLARSGKVGVQTSGKLEQAFLDPPEEAWPWVYWVIMDGTLTREGITADLEAMRRVGIRGVVYLEVDLFVPKGPVRFLSPEWREMLQHVIREASRLGITLNMNNDGGYTGSGGPWITPELSMQVLVWSETRLQGPQTFSGPLIRPKSVRNYYRDIAVLAFPTPAVEEDRMASRAPKISYGSDRKSLDAAGLLQGDPSAITLLPPVPEGESQILNIDFPEPFTARALTLASEPWNSGSLGHAGGFRGWPEFPGHSPIQVSLALLNRQFSSGHGPLFPAIPERPAGGD
ncbi:MAG: glycosyl hydrolase [Terriglobia bacterium]